MKRDERKDDFFQKNFLSDELFLHFSSKVQNLTVFSIIYTIRIRFFGPGELFRKGFSKGTVNFLFENQKSIFFWVL